MNAIRSAGLCSAFLLAAVMTTSSAYAQANDVPQRKELKRADLSGAPGMEVILSISEYKPGDAANLHLHHGVEAAYVLEGGMVQAPGKDPVELKTGTPVMNLRDAPHAGWKVVGDKSIKLITVHVVDKGKPLFDWVKQ
jgi:quercetin dioxygenase-like cupin family protein